MNQKAYRLVKREAQIMVNLIHHIFDTADLQLSNRPALALVLKPEPIYHRGADCGPVGFTKRIEVQIYISPQNTFVLRSLINGRQDDKYVFTVVDLDTFRLVDNSAFDEYGILIGTHRLGVNKPDLYNLDVPLNKLFELMLEGETVWEEIINPSLKSN